MYLPYTNGTCGFSSAVNISLHKKERGLIVKIFYQNDGNSLATLRDYRRIKNLRRGLMCINAKYIIYKFEATSSLDVAPERGQRATMSAIVKEVAIATAEA